MSDTIIIVEQKYCISGFLPCILLDAFAAHVANDDNMHSELKKYFLKEKGACTCTLRTARHPKDSLQVPEFPAGLCREGSEGGQ